MQSHGCYWQHLNFLGCNCSQLILLFFNLRFRIIKTITLFSLQNLYESIKNEPFKIPEDDGNDLTHTFFNPDREGWLLKLGQLNDNVCALIFPVVSHSTFT